MEDHTSIEKRHPIQVAANRSGLTQDLLRAWEKRYAVVEPGRSTGGQRLYSDEDVERLRLLRVVVDGGRRISDVASLSNDVLAEHALEDRIESAPIQSLTSVDPATLVECLAAIEELDGIRLEEILIRRLLAAGSQGFVENLVSPLMVEVGRRWHEGQLLASHEHMATGILRGIFARVLADAQPHQTPVGTIVVATTAGQVHEVGSMMAAATAAGEGWRVVYLGADLPADEIVAAANQVRAGAVALGYALEIPGHDDLAEIRAVIRGLDPSVTVFVGGEAAVKRGKKLLAMGARVPADIPDFRRELGTFGAAA